MSTAPKSKKRSGGDSTSNRRNQKNGPSGISKTSEEPSEQEMVMFQGLLRAKNSAAMAAHTEFSSSQNKAQFFLDIIAVCRQQSANANSNVPLISFGASSTSGGNGASGVPHMAVTSEDANRTLPVKRNTNSNKDAPRNIVGTEKPKNTSHPASLQPPPPGLTAPPSIPAATITSSASPTLNTVAPVTKREKDKPVCTFFSSQGTCRKGKRCRFLHPEGQFQGNQWVSPSTSATTASVRQPDASVDPKGGLVVGPTNASAPSAPAPTPSSSSDSTSSRDDIPRTSSVDHAMGLLDMDVRYLEENLDMHLDDESSEEGAAALQQEPEEQEYSQLFRDLIAGRLSDERQDMTANDVAWLSLNNTEQRESSATVTAPTGATHTSKQASPLPLSHSNSVDSSPLLQSRQAFGSSIPTDPPASLPSSSSEGRYDAFGNNSSSGSSVMGGGGLSEQQLGGQVNSFFNEVISDVIDEVSNSFHQQLQQQPPQQQNRAGPISPRRVMDNDNNDINGNRVEVSPQQQQLALRFQQQQQQQWRQQQQGQGQQLQGADQQGQRGMSGPYGPPYGDFGVPPGMPPPFLPPHGMPPPPHHPMYDYLQQQQGPGQEQEQQQLSPRREGSPRGDYTPAQMQMQVQGGQECRENLQGQGQYIPPSPGGSGYGYRPPPGGFPHPYLPHPHAHMGHFPPPVHPHPMYSYAPPGMSMYGHPGMMPPPPSPQQLQQMQYAHYQLILQQQQQQRQGTEMEYDGGDHGSSVLYPHRAVDELKQHQQQQQQHEQQQQQQQQRQEESSRSVHNNDTTHVEPVILVMEDPPQKPSVETFTAEDFVHASSASPLSSSEGIPFGAEQQKKEEVSVLNLGSIEQREAGAAGGEEAKIFASPERLASSVPSTTTTTTTTHHPVENVKSQKLLSFLKSNVKTNLPSVMTVKFNKSPTGKGQDMSEERTTVTLEAVATELQRAPEVQKEEPKKDKERAEVHYRTTKQQRGTVHITKPPPGPLAAHGSRHAIQPGGHLSLEWDLSQSEVAPTAQLVIALTRLGSMNNANNIIAKSLKVGKNQPLGGNIAFHAPKAAGYYVFRIFDQTNDATKALTLATSSPFAVELKGRDVTTNLAFILKAFSVATKSSKVDTGAINALKNVFELMRTTGAIVNNEKPPQELLQNCVQLLLNMMFKQMSLFDVQAELLQAQQAAGDDAEAIKAAAGTTEVWQNIRSAQKMHMTTYDCLLSMRANKIAMGMLTGEQRAGVTSVIGLYCPLLSRFFKSFTDLQQACTKEIGFEPAPLEPTFRALCLQSHQELKLRSRGVLQDLSRSIASVAGELIPPPSFAAEREDIRLRLQQLMRASGVVPSTCSLVLFGSSKNNFGAAGADLDMCLQYRRGEVLPVGEERGRVIEQLGEVMAREGMLEVQARSTARIPIVLFKDCVSGIDCDISFNNPLAICNTELLATYSLIDTRVRALAFAIKHWAKQREINSPQNGTLSSYGYLLCLIHFLQTRRLVPDLQELPPNWDPMSRHMDPAPVHLLPHPVEGTPCNTYFYDAARNQQGMQKLRKFSSHNKQTLGELMMEFFRYFAYDFDYRRDVVSIHGGGGVTKLSKMESACWGSHERLSVEDPFEPWYDVAHVLKSTQMTYIRAEFLRAYTMMYNAAIEGDAVTDSATGSGSLFERMCAPPSEPPKFVVKQQQAEMRRSRSNTVTSELEA